MIEPTKEQVDAAVSCYRTNARFVGVDTRTIVREMLVAALNVRPAGDGVIDGTGWAESAFDDGWYWIGVVQVP